MTSSLITDIVNYVARMRRHRDCEGYSDFVFGMGVFEPFHSVFVYFNILLECTCLLYKSEIVRFLDGRTIRTLGLNISHCHGTIMF